MTTPEPEPAQSGEFSAQLDPASPAFPTGDEQDEAVLLADTTRLIPVEGEELVFIDIDGVTDPRFPALVDAQRWNGWACPRFRAAKARTEPSTTHTVSRE
ncbi:hypothetical protein [Goodfellowiella coeruleoviolacea]|uniref:Uncharacterized protein n=1 Tax=Goodfellowiella coeruleoviolacea TaxID=334858 RepID=A0AAE3KMD1_9PSEU|nr:hypothetical protein [Goodfellowiella coeruleoviolacea]MCP2167453.1 hypothetical protein [Goodfellowiella coeruleoviolacea]